MASQSAAVAVAPAWAPSWSSQITTDWQCVQCNLAWQTVEVVGQPQTRRLTVIQHGPVSPPSTTTFTLSFPCGAVADPEGVGPDLRELNGSVIGYRAWKLQDWKLAGTGGLGKHWNPGVNEARCAVYRDVHSAPADGCKCGMYALARFKKQCEWWNESNILGAVEAWADVDENNNDRFFVHPTGFRAQFAQIVLLATSDNYPRAKNAAIRALATEHGADVCKREHLEDAAKEHGQLVPEEWLKWASE